MTSARDRGSFRDPHSQVYLDGDDVFRGLHQPALDDFEALAATQFYAAAIDAGRIVGTEAVTADEADLPVDFAAALRHERVPFVSYPYEWTFSMLRDAALLQLDLVADALAEGMITKDASAYNVQFRGSRPVFIDIGSFERLRDGEPWFGYRQFCQLFLYPLYLLAFRGVDYVPLLRGNIDGISPTQCRSMLRRRDLRRRGVFSHVYLQSKLEQSRGGESGEQARSDLKASGFKPELIVHNVNGLRKRVGKLRWKASESLWSTYGGRGHYSDADLDHKRDFVLQAATDRRRRTIVDLGCNDGEFSRLVRDHADTVVAVDGDHLVVDGLYRSLREEGDNTVLPLVMNLGDPSPAIGWRNAERPSFVERTDADLVLGLALIHHLCIAGNAPLDEAVAFFADFGCEAVIEFPHRDDPMVRTLLANKREGLHADYSLEGFERALGHRFSIDRQATLPSGTRTLYQASPRR